MSKRKFYAKKAKDNKIIAKERISILFNEAKKMFSTDKTLSNRYVKLARRIGMKYNTSLSSEEKRKFCKKCNAFLVPSVNCRVRVRNDLVVYYCMECKNFNKFRYK